MKKEYYIKLLEESILRKIKTVPMNAFVYNDERGWNECGTDDGAVFDYMVTCDFCMDGVVKYVHIRASHIGIGMPLDKVNEFLHALRLAGLYEMADKFEL